MLHRPGYCCWSGGQGLPTVDARPVVCRVLELGYARWCRVRYSVQGPNVTKANNKKDAQAQGGAAKTNKRPGYADLGAY